MHSKLCRLFGVTCQTAPPNHVYWHVTNSGNADKWPGLCWPWMAGSEHMGLLAGELTPRYKHPQHDWATFFLCQTRMLRTEEDDLLPASLHTRASAH